jgi:hypothetical protein
LARLKVLLEQALVEIAALQAAPPIATHDGSVHPELMATAMCCDDEPPGFPLQESGPFLSGEA